MDVRRVVTGHNTEGKAVFVSDERVAPITVALMPGAEFHRLWGGDEAPTFPDAGTIPPHHAYFPPVGGFRFGLFTLLPAGFGPRTAEKARVPPAAAEKFLRTFRHGLCYAPVSARVIAFGRSLRGNIVTPSIAVFS